MTKRSAQSTHASRIQILNERPVQADKGFVLYWMQASQRARFNHALDHAIEQANSLKRPVVACFGLMDDYPQANARHYAFMLQGLCDAAQDLKQRGILFLVKRGAPALVVLHYGRDAAMIVCDRGYTRHQKHWRNQVADGAACRVVQVESDVIVPVEIASGKLEFAARTIRPKIHRQLASYLLAPRRIETTKSSLNLGLKGDIDVARPDRALSALTLDHSVLPSLFFKGGSREGLRRVDHFIRHDLSGYAEARRDPANDRASHLSPYLHFGQISALDVALKVSAAKAPAVDREAFLEELIVRRELAVNFVHYHPKYDSYDALPTWAKQTLKQHARDKRPYVYSLDQLERAQTHDRYWNAAQNETTITGYMHNSMRMYWGKKILEWTRSPRRAYQITLYLNDKYFLDGRDPNGYANVAWIFGLHDRPWTRRPIFGTVRYMNAGGLERKFDVDAYVRRIESLSTAPKNDATMQA